MQRKIQRHRLSSKICKKIYQSRTKLRQTLYEIPEDISIHRWIQFYGPGWDIRVWIFSIQ